MIENKYEIGDTVEYNGKLSEITARSNYHPDHGNQNSEWYYSVKQTDAKGITWNSSKSTPLSEEDIKQW